MSPLREVEEGELAGQHRLARERGHEEGDGLARVLLELGQAHLVRVRVRVGVRVRVTYSSSLGRHTLDGEVSDAAAAAAEGAAAAAAGAGAAAAAAAAVEGVSEYSAPAAQSASSSVVITK